MDTLKENQKVIAEIRENIGVSEGTLTSLAQDFSEEQTILLSKDTKNTDMSVDDQPEIENASSGDSELINVTNVKGNMKTRTSNTKQKRNVNVNARESSQKLSKRQSERKNKLRTRRNDDIDMSPKRDYTDVANEDRVTYLDEPKFEIHCKAKYIRLKPISKKDLEGIDLYIEIEVDKDLMVSPIEKHDSDSEEKSKYTFKVSSLADSKASTCSSKEFQSETSKDSQVTRTRVKNKRNREVISVNSKRSKIETESSNKKLEAFHITEARVEHDSLASGSQQGYDSETDTEVSETLLHNTNNTVVTEAETEKLSNDAIVSDEGTKSNSSVPQTRDIQEDKKVGKPKVRRKREIKQKSPKKERHKVKKETTNPVDYTVRITEDGEKMFGCPVCNYESKYSQNIRSHYLIHMNVKPWICEICGSSFVSKCNLRHHMVAHSNDRPFKCTTCGMGFKQKVVLQQHVARHNEDRQFVCEQCGKGFCISGDLKKHIRTHTGEKPYQCETCSKQFSDNSSYARHRYTHQETKNYACTQCNKRFSRQDLCNSHMKTHNNDNRIGAKERKSKVKRMKKSDVGDSNVVGEGVEMDTNEVAPREHMYHIENYAKEIQERTYTEMNATNEFTVVNSGYGQPQQQQQGIQVYPQRQETTVQESYSREYSTMWTTNLHFY